MSRPCAHDSFSALHFDKDLKWLPPWSIVVELGSDWLQLSPSGSTRGGMLSSIVTRQSPPPPMPGEAAVSEKVSVDDILSNCGPDDWITMIGFGYRQLF